MLPKLKTNTMFRLISIFSKFLKIYTCVCFVFRLVMFSENFSGVLVAKYYEAY